MCDCKLLCAYVLQVCARCILRLLFSWECYNIGKWGQKVGSGLKVGSDPVTKLLSAKYGCNGV